MAPLTKDQLIQLAAAFGPSLISGIGQGGQAAADRALTEQDRARQAEQEAYNRRMGARAGLAGFFQNQLTRDINAAGDFAPNPRWAPSRRWHGRWRGSAPGRRPCGNTSRPPG